MTELLIASQVLLWIGVIVLGVILYALTRQVGALFARIAPAGALAVNPVLAPGSAAPELTVPDLDGVDCKVGGARIRSQLVFFLSPDCPICKSLLPALSSIASDEDTDLVIASDGGTQAEHAALREAHALGAYPYLLSEALGRAYGVSKLPYAVLNDTDGRIVSLGIVNTREHIESLFSARELGVGSVQQFVSRDASG